MCYVQTLCQAIHCFINMFSGVFLVRYSGQPLGMTAEGPGFDPLIYGEHLSFFDITAEWPNTTQIGAILSSDGTNNVICI